MTLDAAYLCTTSSVVGYLLGSCPSGLLIGLSRGIDIRRHGSGNIGATNAVRVLGKTWGYLVFFLDALKGGLAVMFALKIGRMFIGPSPNLLAIAAIIAGAACILGHTFPLWLRFRGGKGVATAAGVLLALMPIAVLCVLAVWVGTFLLTRYVSLASIGAAISLPLFVSVFLWFRLVAGTLLLPFSLLIAAVVIMRHRSNIRRLISGTEPRFQRSR